MATRHHQECHWTADLSFLGDSNDDEIDVEVTKAAAGEANKFDPTVGGRFSTPRSSSSRSSGSTGFYEAVEYSPTNSLSPYAFVIF